MHFIILYNRSIINQFIEHIIFTLPDIGTVGPTETDILSRHIFFVRILFDKYV